jgi:ataxia telangiectasia mutated family protein
MPTRPPVLTTPCQLSPTGDYSHVITVIQFTKTFSITESGLSRPKIIDCEGSDGRMYRQLVKSGDDLRQDAVMQQVFENVCLTLRNDSETRNRNLSIRTYKVIPLTSQTGVIEWVDDAIPFGSFLTDKDKALGAHSRYYPDDWSHSKCREILSSASRDQLNEAFTSIYTHFHPVFRFFFIENIADPAKWLASRVAYTRSVAVRL